MKYPRVAKEYALPELISAKEAASLLKMHVNTICRLIESGKLNARLYGRVWRLPAGICGEFRGR
jgi:excisionase family DNA binding protein